MRQANCPEQWGGGGKVEARWGERSAGRGGNIMASVARLARGDTLGSYFKVKGSRILFKSRRYMPTKSILSSVKHIREL